MKSTQHATKRSISNKRENYSDDSLLDTLGVEKHAIARYQVANSDAKSLIYQSIFHNTSFRDNRGMLMDVNLFAYCNTTPQKRPHQVKLVEQISSQCWASVVDGRPALIEHPSKHETLTHNVGPASTTLAQHCLVFAGSRATSWVFLV